jgi:hypothetical protein
MALKWSDLDFEQRFQCRITLDIDTQAMSPEKRKAQTGFVQLFFQEGGERKIS